MEAFLNYRISRIVFGIAIALPLTAISIVAGLYGLVLGYGGIIGAGLYLLFIGMISITGFIGITVVWRRLKTSTENTSKTEKNKTRVRLFCGLVTSIALLMCSLYNDCKTLPMPLTLILFYTLLIDATPRKL
jgi:uncharacterized Tic20 family protein